MEKVNGCYKKILIFLNDFEMITPKMYGWFHIMWIVLTIMMIFILTLKRKVNDEKKLKKVLLVYGVVALILELIKQLMWSFNYDVINDTVTWQYEWYAFPFQLCTTPIYCSLIAAYLKKGNLRNNLLSYMAYTTIIGSICTILFPSSCFVEDILVNIHTMWLHCGSLVVSVYLLIVGEVKIELSYLKGAIKTFIFFVFLALILNIIVYNTNILNDEVFNMFYISPYFISILPVFNVIQTRLWYPFFLLIYIISIILGSFIIYRISLAIRKLHIF